jgi:integrase
MAENSRDLLRVMVGTGLRFGEITALWVEDINLTKRTLSVRKAWNRQSENGQTQIPQWPTKRISAKHEMRGHYLGIPKTPKSRRTITIAPSVVTDPSPRDEGQVP